VRASRRLAGCAALALVGCAPPAPASAPQADAAPADVRPAPIASEPVAAAPEEPAPKDSPAPVTAAAVPADRFTTPVAGGAEFPGAPAPIACGAAPTGMACVPAGPFVRGSDDGPENTRPQARVWLQTYYIDVNEVTYAEYRACMKARKCPPSGPGYTDFSRPRQPINGVDWFDAHAYCAAQGKRLPSEAQWEKAARGPDGALHPWGDEPATCERAIIKDERGRSCGEKKLYDKPATGRPFEVGSRPAGHYGLFDMSGNSWEWVQDWYTRSYAECGADCAGVDPRGPCGGGEACKGLPARPRKLVRGGSWYWDASYATAIYRRPHYPDNQPFHHFGFRCAASADDVVKMTAPAG
jgi:sulfatase modifying factor 1